MVITRIKISKEFKQVYLNESAKTSHLSFEKYSAKLNGTFFALRIWVFLYRVDHFLGNIYK